MNKKIFDISDNACEQILKSAKDSNSENWPLRIGVSVDSSGKFNYLMGFDQSKEEDLRLKIHNIEIIISPDSMMNLKNCVLDYVELEKNNFQFIFINPNDPNYSPSDKNLDNNTTHDL